MAKMPTEFFIEHDITDYSDAEHDADVRMEYVDFPTYESALKAAKSMTGYVGIIRRTNITDETPPEDGTGLIYDWTERKVWES